MANAVKPAHCALCDTWKGEADMVAKIENDWCCLDCAETHNGPGKFEAYHYNESSADELGYLGICLILDQWGYDGNEDENMSSEGWGYCGRFGNYLLYHDTSGFVTYHEYDTVDEAVKAYLKLYEAGMGASEFDAYVFDERSKYGASVEGKHLGVYDTERRAIAAVRLECMRTGYYPDLWLENERGSLTLVENWR